MTVILVAVHDSTAAFGAADAAIALARRVGGRIHAVAVVDSDPVFPGLSAAATLDHRQGQAEAALAHVLRAAEASGVHASGALRRGRIAGEILAEARAVGADYVVVALVDRPGHAIPRVGSHTLRVLELAEVPVLVVPPGE